MMWLQLLSVCLSCFHRPLYNVIDSVLYSVKVIEEVNLKFLCFNVPSGKVNIILTNT